MHSRSFSGVSFTRCWQACSEGAAALVPVLNSACALALNPCCAWARRDGCSMHSAKPVQTIDKPTHFSLVASSSNIGHSFLALLAYTTKAGRVSSPGNQRDSGKRTTVAAWLDLNQALVSQPWTGVKAKRSGRLSAFASCAKPQRFLAPRDCHPFSRDR